MSDTMSSQNDQWLQFYQQQHNPYGQAVVASSTTTMFGRQDSEATVTTAAAAAVTSPSNTNGSSSQSLNPEGRVSKPIRRRSRASRRTPTTLLNTDTTNFRAMVQQFTGGAAAPFASGMSHQYYGSTNMNFDSHRPIRTTAVMAPSSGYNVMQFQQQQQQQQQQQHMFMLNTNSTSSHTDHGFFQRLGNGNTRPSMEVADIGGFGKVEGVGTISSQVAPTRPTSSSSNNDNHRSNLHYMF